MKGYDTIQAERELLQPSYLESVVSLCDDVIDFVIEHAIDDSAGDVKEKAYQRLEMIYCLRDLKLTMNKCLNSQKNGK